MSFASVISLVLALSGAAKSADTSLLSVNITNADLVRVASDLNHQCVTDIAKFQSFEKFLKSDLEVKRQRNVDLETEINAKVIREKALLKLRGMINVALNYTNSENPTQPYVCNRPICEKTTTMENVIDSNPTSSLDDDIEELKTDIGNAYSMREMVVNHINSLERSIAYNDLQIEKRKKIIEALNRLHYD